MPTLYQSIVRLTALGAALASLVGCDSMPTRDPAFAPSFPPQAPVKPQQVASSGGIYQPQAVPNPLYNVDMFRDHRAYRVGDILTITLSETTNSSKDADTDFSNTTDVSVTNPTVFGVQPSVRLPGFSGLTRALTTDRLVTEPAGGRYTLDSNLQSSRTFNGAAESTQSNSLTGTITVTVAEVIGNGNLLVRGEKLYTLNRGHEHIRFSGIVRPQDIDADNTVVSTRVANAQIIYAGEGEIAASNKAGWLTRFITEYFPL